MARGGEAADVLVVPVLQPSTHGGCAAALAVAQSSICEENAQVGGSNQLYAGLEKLAELFVADLRGWKSLKSRRSRCGRMREKNLWVMP